MTSCKTHIDDFNNLDALIDQYQHDLTHALDALAPIKTKIFVERRLIPWINQEILNSRKSKQKLEKIWRKSKLTVHSNVSIRVKTYAIPNNKSKAGYCKTKVEECSGNQGNIFKLISHLQNTKAKPTIQYKRETG